MSSQNFPVHDSLDVLDGATVYKTDEWWKAVVVYERYGRRLGIYLWHRDSDKDRWVRKQKYVIRKPEDWGVDKELVSSFLPMLDEEDDSTGGDAPIYDDGPDIEAILKDLTK